MRRLLIALFVLGLAASASAQPQPRIVTADRLEVKAGPWFDVRAWGAKGNGSADDTAGIQAAINAAPDWGVVYIPPGLYRVTATLTILKPLVVRGDGYGSEILFTTALGATDDVFYVHPPTNGAYATFRDFAILPYGASAGRHGINLDATHASFNGLLIQKMRIQGMAGRSINIAGAVSEGSVLLGTIADNSLHRGIAIANCGDTVQVLRNAISGTDAGLDVDFASGASTFIVEGNNLTSDGGIHLGANSVGLQFLGNELETFATFTGSNGAFVDVDGVATDVTIAHNSFQIVNGITTNSVRVNLAARTHIYANRFSTGATTSKDIVVTASAVDTIIGTNLWITNTPVISDTGTSTRLAGSFGGQFYVTGPSYFGAVPPTGVAWLPPVGNVTAILATNTAPNINTGSVLSLSGRYRAADNGAVAFASIAGLKENVTNSDLDGYLAFFTSKTTLSANTERMRIASTGNVGIGMPTPARLLDVAGTFGATGAASFSSTVGVTGATTLAGLLTANGGITADSGAFTVADTTGNIGTTGTLSVTGATTLSSSVGHPSYVSQLSNWRVTAAGAADFRYLYTDELHAKAFVADLEQALVGGQIISKSVVVVAAAFTLPAPGGLNGFVVEDIANMAGVDVFVAGDFVRFRQFARGVNTLDIADAWGTISAAGHTHNGDGTQTWAFDRSAAPNAGTATGTITRGQLAIDYGVSGNGLIEATVLDGLGQANAPYTRYLTWTTHPRTGQVVQTQIGNLNGNYDYATPTYGFASGPYVVGGSFVTVDPTNGVRMMSRIAGPSNVTRFQLAADGSGSLANGNISWTTAGVTKIAGWVIGTDSLTDTAGVVGMSSAVTGGDDIRFWAGHATPASAPFYVTEAGALHATNATISGNITANSGTFGYGRNQLQTTEFAKGVGDSVGDGLGWRVGGGTDSFPWTIGWNYVTHPLALYLQTTGASASGTYRDLYGPRVPITASTVYEFSTYMGLSRGTSARLLVSWRNAADAEISADFVGTACTTASAGGLTLAGYCRTGGVATSPALAVNAFLVARIFCDGSTNPILFMRRPMFAEGHAGQTTISEWGPGGVTLITSDGIKTGAITANEIAANTITAAKIAASTITTTELNFTPVLGAGAAADVNANATTIAGTKITASSITTSQIAANTIVAGNIAANTITASQIAANTITASQIAAGTITATELNVSTLSAISANLGTVTAGSVSGVTITGSSVTGGSGSNTVTLDSDGLTLKEGSATANKLKWDGGGYIYGNSNELSLVAGVVGVSAASFFDVWVNGNAILAANSSGVFPGANGSLNLGASNLHWGTYYGTGLNLTGEITSSAWAGSGTRFVCAGNDGVTFASATACDLSPTAQTLVGLQAEVARLQAMVAALSVAR